MAESMPPEAIGSLKGAGLKVDTTIYPAILKWNFSYVPGSPLRDLRVRKAANLAIDREGLVNFSMTRPLQPKAMLTNPRRGLPKVPSNCGMTRLKPGDFWPKLASVPAIASNLRLRFPVAAKGK